MRLLLAMALQACSTSNSETTTAPAGDTQEAVGDSVGPDGDSGDDSDSGSEETADVTAVTVTGSGGAYTFAVTLASPDTGCDRYANWWEVLDEDGTLVYRRILAHSHVDEQPFTRTGGPVDVTAEQRVYVRAHMDPGGYGGDVFVGSADAGFELATPPPTLDASTEAEAPQPDGCAF